MYQEACRIPIDVHYGPGSPNEAALQLIGPVAGLHVLEVGCGGAQCSIAFAKQGAIVTAVDIAAVQLAFARELARREQVDITFHQRDMTDLTPIASGSQDLVFSAFAFGYVDDLEACFREVYRVLRPGGRFVWSQGHPFYDTMNATTLRLERSYFATGKYVEGGPDDVPFAGNQRKVSDYFNLLIAAGFSVERMLEPDSRQRYPYDPWYELWEFTPELMAFLPPTIIFKCRKP
jgi:SAM-dependent methyltransferase